MSDADKCRIMTQRDRVRERMEYIWTLTEGWSGYGDRPISQAARTFYEKVFEQIDDKYLSEIEPLASDGGVKLEWEAGEYAYSASIDHDGSLWLCMLAPKVEDDQDWTIPKPEPSDLISFIEQHPEGLT